MWTKRAKIKGISLILIEVEAIPHFNTHSTASKSTQILSSDAKNIYIKQQIDVITTDLCLQGVCVDGGVIFPITRLPFQPLVPLQTRSLAPEHFITEREEGGGGVHAKRKLSQSTVKKKKMAFTFEPS